MSYKRGIIFPANPQTARSVGTKLGVSGEKLVYTNGKTVIIRDLSDISNVIVYTGHVQSTTVARISPTGYYCASADTIGNVRVWDLVGDENILKHETKAFAGRINDLVWDGESKRIIAVGDGREKFGVAFMFDTGTSTGEIVGHSKPINSVSIRHQRPFRAVTAADDAQIIFHSGVPFKYERTIKTHTRFVQDVRYAPNGEVFVSVGSDAKIFLYDGKTGDTQAELTASPHKGSIFAAAWSPESSSLITSAADGTVKLWDVATQKQVSSWVVGSEIGDQQVGNAWAAAGKLVSLSTNGNLNIFDKRESTGGPTQIVYGPTKSVTASTLIPPTSTFYVGSYDGRIISGSMDTGVLENVNGDGHTNLVSGLTGAEGGRAWSVGYDDKVKEITANGFSPTSESTNGQPKGVASTDDGTIFVITTNGIAVYTDGNVGKKVADLPLTTITNPNCIAVSGRTVAIGADDQKLYLYTWDGTSLKETAKFDKNKSAVTAVAFSPDGRWLAAGESSGKILIFTDEGNGFQPKPALYQSRFQSHSGRINALRFHPSNEWLVSGSLDTHVYVWNVVNPGQKKAIQIPNAGMGGVNTVEWVGPSTVLSTGGDASLRTWELSL